MGAQFSPSLANLYMGWWERVRIFGDTNPFCPAIKMYQRYIDDLLFICSGNVGDMDTFLSYINDNKLNLRCIGHMDGHSILFLDVLLSSREGHIFSSLYRKPLSGNTLLRADFGYPRHTK